MTAGLDGVVVLEGVVLVYPIAGHLQVYFAVAALVVVCSAVASAKLPCPVVESY